MTTRIGTVFADGLILLVFVIALFFIHLMSGSRKQLIYGAEDRISVEYRRKIEGGLFNIVYIRKDRVEGECTRTTYYRLVLQKQSEKV